MVPGEGSGGFGSTVRRDRAAPDGSEGLRVTSRRSFRRLLSVAALAIASAGALLPGASRAEHWSPPPTVWVEATGHTADRLFLEAWRGEPDLLGNPITEEFPSRFGFASQPDADRVVQYYQNVALAYVPEAPAGEQVQTLDLGRMALDQRLAQYPSAALLRADEPASCGGAASCLEIADTRQTLRGPFLAYWEERDGGRWFGDPLTEAFRAPDGSVVQYFEKGALRLAADRAVRPLPLGEQMAKFQKLDTRPIPKPDDIPVFDESLFVEPPLPEPEPERESELEPELAPAAEAAEAIEEAAAGWGVGEFGPGPQQGAWKEIVISISGQAMWAYENGELVTSTYVSTGTGEVPETVTPIGHWSILTKYDIQDMEGTISDEYYFVEDVPHVMYFDNLGNALHGAYWHSNFGAPMSHGCVNLPLDVAAFLYEWAPVGTAVSVIE